MFRWVQIKFKILIKFLKVGEKEVERLYKDVQKFSLVFCLQEIIWSLVKLESNLYDFDTLQYGILRYQQYHRNKYNILSFSI